MTQSSHNVASHLELNAVTRGEQPALMWPATGVKHSGNTPHHQLTFAELNQLVDSYAHGLATAGVNRGMRVAMMVPPSPQFFSLTFALLKLAAVPVMVDPGMGVKNLGICLAEAEPEVFIGVPKAHLVRRIFRWAHKSIRLTVNAGRYRLGCHHSTYELNSIGQAMGEYHSQHTENDDVSAILFTSGSTGVAKGAVYTHGIFSSQVEILRTTYQIVPGEIDLCTFPLFALFSPALGMASVIPQMNFSRPATIDPRRAESQIRQFGVTNLFGSPTVMRQLATLDQTTSAKSFCTLKRVISAGAPVPASVIRGVMPLLLKGINLYTPYGATEALPVANVSSDELLSQASCLTDQGHGVCIGEPVDQVRVKIIAITDDPIAKWNDNLLVEDGEIGEFVVAGPVVTQEYYNRPDATKLAKIYDPASGSMLHRMGDVGYRDKQGRLWYCGRKNHRVVTKRGVLYTEMVEGIINAVPGVFRSALVGVKSDDHTLPVVCIEPEQHMRWPVLLDSVRKHASQYELTQDISIFLRHNSFPVDVRHNAKIFREKLAVWAAKQLRRSHLVRRQ